MQSFRPNSHNPAPPNQRLGSRVPNHFEGAFTGGFDASLKSNEGFRPADFKSQRNQKNAENDRRYKRFARDFMDDEDLEDEICSSRPRKNFSDDSDQNIVSILEPKKDIIGQQLMKWRGLTQEIAYNEKLIVLKNDKHGIDYIPQTRIGTDEQTKSNRFKSIDEDDVYYNDDITHYDIASSKSQSQKLSKPYFEATKEPSLQFVESFLDPKSEEFLVPDSFDDKNFVLDDPIEIDSSISELLRRFDQQNYGFELTQNDRNTDKIDLLTSSTSLPSEENKSSEMLSAIGIQLQSAFTSGEIYQGSVPRNENKQNNHISSIAKRYFVEVDKQKRFELWIRYRIAKRNNIAMETEYVSPEEQQLFDQLIDDENLLNEIPLEPNEPRPQPQSKSPESLTRTERKLRERADINEAEMYNNRPLSMKDSNISLEEVAKILKLNQNRLQQTMRSATEALKTHQLQINLPRRMANDFPSLTDQKASTELLAAIFDKSIMVNAAQTRTNSFAISTEDERDQIDYFGNSRKIFVSARNSRWDHVSSSLNDLKIEPTKLRLSSLSSRNRKDEIVLDDDSSRSNSDVEIISSKYSTKTKTISPSLRAKMQGKIEKLMDQAAETGQILRSDDILNVLDPNFQEQLLEDLEWKVKIETLGDNIRSKASSEHSRHQSSRAQEKDGRDIDSGSESATNNKRRHSKNRRCHKSLSHSSRSRSKHHKHDRRHSSNSKHKSGR